MRPVILVVPCYNEAKRLNVPAFRSFARLARSVQILFVNDGSSDDTHDVLSLLRDETPDAFKLLSLERNSGKAEAVRQGCLHAFKLGPQAIGYWDADLATPLEAALDFQDTLFASPHRELVCGARVKLLGRSIKRQTLRHYLGRIFATCASLALGLAIYDTQCGAKLFRASRRMQQAFQRPFLSRWLFDVEILARLQQGTLYAGLPALEDVIYEFPLLQWHDIAGSKVKPMDFVKATLELARIYWTYFPRTLSPALLGELTSLAKPAAAPARLAG